MVEFVLSVKKRRIVLGSSPGLVSKARCPWQTLNERNYVSRAAFISLFGTTATSFALPVLFDTIVIFSSNLMRISFTTALCAPPRIATDSKMPIQTRGGSVLYTVEDPYALVYADL
jgi:hypothetical protein